jgi:excisionase family DNA binding protein
MTRPAISARSWPPRAMKAETAAAYLDISRSKFYELVDRGVLPRPRAIDGVRLWDRLSLESAFEAFGEGEGDRPNTFDIVLGGNK